MSCSTCGSQVPCGCRTDPALGNCSTVAPGCCQNVVSPTPTPFYQCAPSCPESHVQKIVLQQFYGTITVADSWNIPACEGSAVLNVLGLKSIGLGSYIWNSDYGYFEVTAFNSSTGQITVVNHCTNHCGVANEAAGTSIPSCTEFTITAPPCDTTDPSQVCVTIDFTGPLS